MKAARKSEKSVNFHQITRRNNSEGNHRQTQNVKTSNLTEKCVAISSRTLLKQILSQQKRPHSIIHLLFSSTLILSSHLLLRLQNGLLLRTLHVFLVSFMHATCPVHLLPDLITIKIYCENYKLWSSSV